MIPRRSAAATLLPLALLCFAGACAHETPPELRVSQITMGPRTDEAIVVYFTLDAWNENDIVLPTRSATYTVALDGREVFRGTRSPEVALRDRATQSFRLPATIAAGTAGLPRGTMPYTLRGTLNYAEPGRLAELFFDTGVRRPNVGFSGAGTINFDAATGAPAADIPPGPERRLPQPPAPPPAAPAEMAPPPRPARPTPEEAPAPRPQPQTPAPSTPPAPVMTPPTASPPPGATPPMTPAPATPTPPPPPPPPREGFVPGRPVPR